MDRRASAWGETAEVTFPRAEEMAVTAKGSQPVKKSTLLPDPFEDFLADIAEETGLHPSLVQSYRCRAREARRRQESPWVPLPAPPPLPGKLRRSMRVAVLQLLDEQG